MTVQITRDGKYALQITTPVMPAAGTFGYGDAYRKLIKYEKLGAIVTNPITYEPWSPARGTRLVPMESGMLLHTGLPNPGLSRVLRAYRDFWSTLPVPVIVHLVATSPEHVRKSASRIDEEESVAAIELGLPDDISAKDAALFTRDAKRRCEKPLLVRLPLLDAPELAAPVADAGADALVIAAPPRGTARDPLSGRLVSGRVYGPLVKPMVLRLVGHLVRRLGDDIPVIGAGGIHTTQDARDFLEAGARAVQTDTVTWIQPQYLERISRDLGGWIVTRATGAFPDEWHPGMGDTEWAERNAPTPADKAEDAK
ncbi:MAG: hypothetical protein D6712_16640 [Chloroflexi bacterium]|nr:MAG: hypothetical protein D6712_16640 [Chloroflexota bacterium]